MERSITEKELLTAKELAEFLSMSPKFVQKHISTKRLPGMVRCGRSWRFRKSEVQKRLLCGQLLLEKVR